jgi:hypothetical protein
MIKVFFAARGDELESFELLRARRHDQWVMLCAFDLIELDGKDLRPSRWSGERPYWRSSCAVRCLDWC